MWHGWTQWLFNPSGLTPHGFCLLWNPPLIWLHAVSDAGIGVAYLTIPFALLFIMGRRPDLVFRPVFGLFAAFILLCGCCHIMDVVTLWVPAYGLDGILKAATFMVSALTAVLVWACMPQTLALPSPAQLRQANQDLRDVRQAELRMAAVADQAAATRDALAQELARRQTAEALLHESEERLQILLQSRVTEALYLLDPNGKIETWNAGAERIKGYAAADIIGRDFSVFFTQEDQAAGQPALFLAAARAHGWHSTTAPRVRKDGSHFLARVSIDAVHRADGTLRGFVIVTQDITDEWIEEQQRAIIIDAAPNGMMIVDETGTITLANSQCERMFGYAPAGLTGQSIELLVPDGLRGKHIALRARFTDGDDVRSMAMGRVVTGRTRAGADLPIEILLTPVETPRGRIVIAAIFDVTEQKRLQAEQLEAESRERRALEETYLRLDRLSQDLAQARDRAEHANQAKSRFLASITHELRTPLHGILGYAELMNLEGGLTQTQSERLEVMMAAGQHLLAMVNSVLDMSQIESDQLELHPVETDLTLLIGICLDIIRPVADAKELALIQAPCPALRVVVDATRLRQVVMNLLGNAVKFTRAGAVEVRLRQTKGGTCFRLEVVDTGPGVRAAHHAKLFQTFERLNAEAVSSIEGTGLGLAIAARLIQLMHGQIGYQDNPAGGSIFWLELPADLQASPSPIDMALPAPAPHARDMRVLVADDEALNRSIAQEFLRRAGHAVVCVGNGAAAVEAASRDDFDAILMDVRMPGMNGLEATRLIRNLPPPRGQVCVVAVTAQAFAQQIETCRQAGMDLHVSKPFTQAALIAALDIAARTRHLAPVAPPTETHAATHAAGHAEPAVAVFDSAAFASVAEYLPASDIARYLRTLVAHCADVRARLGQTIPQTPDDALAQRAHSMCGNAGILGFASIAACARALEYAAETAAPDMQARACDLVTAIDSAMPLIKQQLMRMEAAPAD